MTDMDTFRHQVGGLEPWDGSAAPAKVRAMDVITSVLGLGPIPATQVINTVTMVNEANRIPAATEGLTPAESVTRTRKIAAAKEHIEKVCKGSAEATIKDIKNVMARINLLTDTISRVEHDPVIGANGEQLATDEAQDQHDTLRDQVNEEIAAGSVQHHIRRARTKSKELLLMLLDYPVFVLAMFSIFNVSLRLLFAGDGATLILAITSAVFALMGTLLYGYVMRTFGRRHRVFKNAAGGMTASGSTRVRLMIEQGLAIGITAAAAAVMATRIWIEGMEAEAPVALILALAALFAVLLGVSGYINYMSEYENGSDTVDRIQHLSAQLGHRTATLDNLNTQLSLLIEEAGIKIASLNRLLATTLEHAVKSVVTSPADKAITLARSYHASTAAVPVPDLTSPSLELTRAQAEELTAHHAALKNTHKEK